MADRTIIDRFMDQVDHFFHLRGRTQAVRMNVLYRNELRDLERQFWNNFDDIQLTFTNTPIESDERMTLISYHICCMSAINARIEYLLNFPPNMLRDGRLRPLFRDRNFRQ